VQQVFGCGVLGGAPGKVLTDIMYGDVPEA